MFKMLCCQLVILFYSCFLFGQYPTLDELTRYLELVRCETGAPGISVTVAMKGKVLMSTAAGYAELDNKVLANERTVHNIASLSKIHSTVAILQLVECGKVDLDAPIQAYVPYFPQKPWPITLRHILTHTSGIRHYNEGEIGEGAFQEKIHFDTLEEAISFWKNDILCFKPGEYWLYSSYAFNLLQGVVEEVTGTSFEEYLKEHVWNPAGMVNTQFDVPERIVSDRGRGYEFNKLGELVNIPYTDVSYKYASGGIISTTEDLARFGVCLNAGVLLKSETLEMMYTVHVDPVISRDRQGDIKQLDHKQALCWFVRWDINGRQFFSHTGTVKGCRSYFANYPDEQLVITLIANVLPFDSEKYGDIIAQMFLKGSL